MAELAEFLRSGGASRLRHGLVAALLAHARTTFWVLAGLCFAGLAVSFVFDPFNDYFDWRDYWVHAAVLHEWASGDLLAPHNPHYDSPAPSREYTPWFLALVLLMKATGWSQFAALQVAACAGTLLLYVGIYRFFTAYFGTAIAAVFGFIAAFLLWGNIWEFVGFFNYRSQLFSNYYPAAACLGMVLLLWGLVVEALRAARPLRLAAIAALFAVLMMSHQLSGGYALGGAGLLILLGDARSLRDRLATGGAIIAGGALAALWPIYDPWQVVATVPSNNHDWAAPTKYSDLTAVLIYGWPQFLGLAGLLRPRTLRRLLPITIGFAGCFGVFLVGIETGNLIAHRFFPFAALFLSIGIAALWLALLPGGRGWVPPIAGRSRQVLIALSLAVAVPATMLQLGAVARDYYGAWAYDRDPVKSMFATVSAAIAPDSVSIATPGVSLSLNAFGRKIVAIPRGLYIVPDEEQRKADNERFFTTDSDSERQAIVARWHVRHIVFRTGRYRYAWSLDMLPPEVIAALERMGQVRKLPNQFVIVDLP